MSDNKMVRITGLWENDSNNGKYLSGSLGTSRILIFKNKFKKEGDNQPDFNVYFAEQNSKETAETKSVPKDKLNFKAPTFTDDAPF